jgi:hypothetical protein
MKNNLVVLFFSQLFFVVVFVLLFLVNEYFSFIICYKKIELISIILISGMSSFFVSKLIEMFLIKKILNKEVNYEFVLYKNNKYDN